MKLLVIFTGGTIGSSVQGEFIGTDENKKYQIIEECLSDRDDVEVITKEPYTILSENLMGENINRLAECIEENKKGVDGIIVTHGTDTLQYMAAGLSLLFPDIELPIVLVSSNYVLEDNRSNGINNFNAAADYIAHVQKLDDVNDKRKEYCGVYVVYTDFSGSSCIHNSAMVLPYMPYDDEVISVNHVEAGKVMGREFFLNSTYAKRRVGDIIKEAKKTALSAFGKDEPCREYLTYSDVLWIREHPGANYTFTVQNVKAVLLESYHSGTYCAENKTLCDFLKQCNELSIPVFLVGIADRTPYESTKFLTSYRVNIFPEISPIFAYMLLWLV